MLATILYKTDAHLDCDRTNIREQIEDILEDLDNFEFKEFSNEENMFSMIHLALGKPIHGVTVCNIWENKNTLYEGYFIDITEDQLSVHDNINMNMFGSQLTAQHVTGNLVIVKKKLCYTVENNNVKTFTEPDSIYRTELIDMMESIFIKDGIVIDPCGTMNIYKYIMNPLEHIMLSDAQYADHYIYHEYEIYTHIMIIIADTREVNGTPNHIASFLAGKPVNGTVFVATYKKPDYNENPPYISLTLDRLKKILAIRQKSSSLTTGMSSTDKEYINFEKILELEYNKHSNKPSLLLSEITGTLLNLK